MCLTFPTHQTDIWEMSVGFSSHSLKVVKQTISIHWLQWRILWRRRLREVQFSHGLYHNGAGVGRHAIWSSVRYYWRDGKRQICNQVGDRLFYQMPCFEIRVVRPSEYTCHWTHLPQIDPENILLLLHILPEKSLKMFLPKFDWHKSC